MPETFDNDPVGQIAGGAAEILVALARLGGFFRLWFDERTVISNRVVNAVHPWPDFQRNMMYPSST
jgi:hypothetical protein